MSKRRKKRYNRNNEWRSERKTDDFTKLGDLLRPSFIFEQLFSDSADKHRIREGDKRRWRPSADSGLRRIDGRLVEYKVVDSKKSRFEGQSQTLAKVAFADAKKVMVCKRRKERRAVLFAKHGSGRGIKIKSPIRRYNDDSDVVCHD